MSVTLWLNTLGWVVLVAPIAGEVTTQGSESSAQLPFLDALIRTATALAPNVSPIILA